MLKALQATSPIPVSEPKAKLKSVLGFAASGTPKDVETLPSLAGNNGYRRTPAFSRRSIDSVASYQVKGKTRSQRTSVADGPFFEDDAVTVSKDVPASMKNGIAPRSMPSRRAPGRGEKQEGHWAISVAETPHDTTSFSLYIKSEFTSRLLHGMPSTLPGRWTRPARET